jgi:hypothetical protein
MRLSHSRDCDDSVNCELSSDDTGVSSPLCLQRYSYNLRDVLTEHFSRVRGATSTPYAQQYRTTAYTAASLGIL